MFKVASINQGGASREMIYGYARVSTANQRLDRQVRSIEQWAGERRIEKTYREKYTGTTIEHPVPVPGKKVVFHCLNATI